MSKRAWINLLAFQAGWFACVLARDVRALVAIAILLALHFAFAADRRREAAHLAVAGLLGAAADTLLERTGILTFRGGPRLGFLCPLWIVALWLNFATTLSGCLFRLQRRLWLAGLLGAAAGPLTYLGAQRLGAVTLHDGALPALAVEYGAVTPLLFGLARRRRS